MKTTIANIDIAEYESIFRSHYPELCGFANKYLDDLDASEEVVQQIFVKLWENKSELSIVGSIRSYLFSAVRNGCLNQIKHIKIRETFKEHNQREIEQNAQYADEEMDASELELKIKASIDALPEKRKKIFILSRYEGLKYKEIAEKLNISVKTVEHQMGSAIKQLKSDLADYMVLFCFFCWNIFNNY
ncbi:RNA polymerase sigma-70 factor [Paracrocinitomix mangrovi]|uniref:RNA polymerase sigma-70 factor n=1 Tax=Paracrocinitomix mangrovi TaxID=2862509 RepID=UPI001C8D9026|nr:RNA polymerase sigma-70 factor [Paracrocinitomix mangrovi]UKN01076.1 RNA polymerase sigma-70 factor [Paracrocinitomix mangrovi]